MIKYYRYYIEDIIKLFLGALPMMAASGLIYWFARRNIEKKRFGIDFKEVRRKAMLNEIIRLLFVIWAALIIGSTLDPKWGFFINIFDLPPYWQVIPQFGRDRMHELLNMLMFVPIGLALPFAFPINNTKGFKGTLTEFGLTVFAGFCFTFEIEYLQGFSPNRYGDINDIITNTLGTVTGYLLYMLIKAVFPRFTTLCKTSADEVYSEIHE